MNKTRDAAIEAAAKAIDRAEIAWCSQNPDDSFSEMPCDIKARAAILAYDQHRAKQEPVGFVSNCGIGQLEREGWVAIWRTPVKTTDIGLYASPQPADVGALRGALEKFREAFFRRANARSSDEWNKASDDLLAVSAELAAAISSSGGAKPRRDTDEERMARGDLR